MSRSSATKLVSVAAAAALTAAFAYAPATPSSGGPFILPPPKSKIDTPLISCGTATQVSINIDVTAPPASVTNPNPTGLPAGFSIQWMTLADYTSHAVDPGPDLIWGTGDDILVANTWFASDDPRLCKASFSGNAQLSRYNLLPGQSVTVNVGEFLFDNGASSNCIDALLCGTDYVFRAFGHATNKLMRSDFTANLQCSTLACAGGEGCTFTQGYWKTHGPAGCVTGNNENEWPAAVLTNGMLLGTSNYTDAQLCSILNTPAQGNGLIALAHQLIAAKLNIANGSDPTAAAAAIAAADALIGGLVVPPVGGGSLAPSATSALTAALTSYNEGAIGPGHCQ